MSCELLLYLDELLGSCLCSTSTLSFFCCRLCPTHVSPTHHHAGTRVSLPHSLPPVLAPYIPH